MPAHVIQFPSHKPTPPAGFGAREALIEALSSRMVYLGLGWHPDGEAVTDYVLALLREAGFKVVRIEPPRDAA